MRFYSIIIPLYNRPQEIGELLDSLTRQTYPDFEVLIIEDGSEKDARTVVESYCDSLDIRYFYIPNGGQGFARNVGFREARGDYFVVFDSDCLIPDDYLAKVEQALQNGYLDAYGGPDAAHPSFTSTQKAISYAMTSPFTTGGIRGNKRHVGKFHPRSFNMGISRETWEKTGGFRWTNKSEDMEFSIRMSRQGLRIGLIPDAVVFHKRRTTFTQFFKQAYSFGQGRIRIFRSFPGELKAVHALPAVFTLGMTGWLLLLLLQLILGWSPCSGLLLCLATGLITGYFLLIFLHATYRYKNPGIGLYSVYASLLQLLAYGMGFLGEGFNYLVKGRSESERGGG